jgi:DNA repair protein RecO (recombination protein O)
VARARNGGGRVARTTRALVLARVAFGESDLIITLFTESVGRVSVLARGGRKSQKRFGGSLEPMHTLSVRFDERAGAELAALREATLAVARVHLVADLDRMQAAGRALGWVRRACPPHTPEPEVWLGMSDLLDRLNDPASSASPALCLAEAGLRLLGALGWGLDFERCVRCGKPCEPGRAALVDAARGGLVCRGCGGARRRVEGAARERLRRAAEGQSGALAEPDAGLALELVDEALLAHAGLEA